MIELIRNVSMALGDIKPEIQKVADKSVLIFVEMLSGLYSVLYFTYQDCAI